ncbi:isoprenylcysteine carboxylmethyltransferase family protein, partial [Candidatus Bathyarchaeota archaeon]|nr:isoprenylcysteine carboxylmethyltransferase family protein [Candidatus Bathyarchaeota archaeon]
MHERGTEDPRRSVVKTVFLFFLILIIQIAIFFVSAGRIDILRAWVFFAVTFVYLVLSNLVLYRFNPGLVAQRLKIRREGSKSWDEVLMRVNNLILILVVPVFAGLDIGRFQWSSLSLHYAVVGFVLYVFGSILISWAMIVNPYFEATVRIQKDRGHRVVTTGPYRFVRHPSYLGAILWTLSIPLIMGSLLAFVPAGIHVLSTGIRTSLEDRTLLGELDGYSDYAGKVRYRLF